MFFSNFKKKLILFFDVRFPLSRWFFIHISIPLFLWNDWCTFDIYNFLFNILCRELYFPILTRAHLYESMYNLHCWIWQFAFIYLFSTSVESRAGPPKWNSPNMVMLYIVGFLTSPVLVMGLFCIRAATTMLEIEVEHGVRWARWQFMYLIIYLFQHWMYQWLD